MKINKLNKVLISNLIIYGSFLFSTNINSNANNENIDLTYKSVVKNFGGSNSDGFNSATETSDGGVWLFYLFFARRPLLSLAEGKFRRGWIALYGINLGVIMIMFNRAS